MHNDDRPVGRFLSRREALALFGASATASLAPRAQAQTAPDSRVLETPDCIAQPQQTEGPYFVDKVLERSDIRIDPATGERQRRCVARAAVHLLSRDTGW